MKTRLKKPGRKVSRTAVPRILRTCRDEVLDFEQTVRIDPSPEAYHELRITCKHMRYTAEFFRSCYGKTLNNVMRLMTQIQDELGRAHDADVHVDYVAGYISRLDRRSSRQRLVQKDLEVLINSKMDTRMNCLTRFYTVWPEALDELQSVDFGLKRAK